MTRSSLPAQTLGAYTPGDSVPRQGAAAFREALAQLGTAVSVVGVNGRPAIVTGGTAQFGVTPKDGQLPLLGHAPAVTPERLGDRTFLEDYGLRAPYVVGEMANGIASEALVEASANAGLLGIFGAAGLPVPRVTQALERLAALGGKPWGINLIHSPDDQKLEAALVDLFLARRVRVVSASAYLDLTLPLVKWRVAGIRRDERGTVTANRLIAKVSRVEVARKFLEPPPERFLRALVESRTISADQAALAAQVPMADDVTCEADSGGHTDNRPLVLLLPAIQSLRDDICQQRGYARRPRIGAAGGIATPASVASAFAMGAAYVVTGSINQATREAGTSDLVRQLLAQASPTDVAMAPAADMFEMGVKVQVLTRGTLFAVRAQRLYELYRAFDSIEALPPAVRAELESKYFRSTLETAWSGCERFFSERDPSQLDKARADPKHRLALLFRAYLGQASKWANEGVADRALDFRIWCGPAMGAFNAWAKGSALERWEARDVVTVAQNLLAGACVLTRAAALRTQGVVLPPDVETFTPKEPAELEAMLRPAETPAIPVEAAREAAADQDKTAPRRKEPIAIVGIGAMFPRAENLAAFWRLLRTGRDAVGDVPPTHFSLADYFDPDPKAPDRTYARRGAFLSPTPFDPTEFGIPPSILEATDTAQLLALVVAKMALEDAGYPEDGSWDRSRTSVLLGVTGTQELVIALGARLGHPHWKKALADAGVDEATAKDVVERISASYVSWQENSFPGLLGNVVAGRIANRFDLGGTNCVVDAACASSLGALHLAVAELESGRADMVLTGGVDTLNDIFMHMCFSKTPALSPTGDARPFSDQADGTLLGEGLGMVVLKRLSDAERDGDRIYALVRGLGTSSDGRAKSIYAPLPKGQARAITAAYRDANVRPRDIGLLEAHGTGTKAGDAAEFEGLRSVFRSDSPDEAWCALGSVKSQVGHTKAAAGAAGLIKAALALHHRVIPPTIKVDRPNPSLSLGESPFAIPTAARPWLRSSRGPRLAGISSFGFGGSNFHAVLEEYGTRRAEPAWDGSVEIFAWSAPDPGRLLALVKASLEGEVRASETRAQFRHDEALRLVAVVEEGRPLSSVLTPVLDAINAGQPFSTPEGVVLGAGRPPGSIAFLFPGQGAQHVDMLRDLSTVFPELLESVEAMPEIAARIYPLPTFDADLQRRREAALTRTDVAQPAIGLVGRGALRLLGRFGVRPALVAGHSYGELLALHAAQVLSASAFEQVSLRRGKLMAGDGSDRGAMVAVLAPLVEVERLLAEERLELTLANRNGPSQGVLSGARAEIERAEAACRARGLRTTRLNVGAAFHSPLVAPAARAFGAALEAFDFSKPAIPVVSNTTGKPYPADPGEARALLANQLAEPVRFDAVVERLYVLGARTFVEVGPRAALTGMVKAILSDRPVSAMALDAQSKRGGLFDLAVLLARLAAEGHPVRLSEWQKSAPPPRWVHRPPRVPKMVVPLTGANYRNPVTPRPPAARPIPAAAAGPATTNGVHVNGKNGTPSGLQPPAMTAAGEEALRLYQENLKALQALQEQTARVHQLFLEGQLVAQQNIAALLAGPQALPALPAAAPFGTAAGVQPPVAAEQPLPAVVPTKPLSAPAAGEAAPAARPGLVTVAPRAPAATSAGAGDVVASLLQVVSEATGYPVETLALGMDLEADLGIDSIKRVEILSLLARRIPGAPSVNPEKLGSLRTLQQVADFVRGTNPPPPRETGEPSRAPSAVDAKETLLGTVSELTGYPRETLSLEMDLEADLGIDSIKRVEILSLLSRRIPGAPSVNPEKLSGLKTLSQVLDFIGASSGGPAASPAPVPGGVALPTPDLEQVLLATVSELTGYPLETLALSMDLEADLGIDSIKRVEILSLLSRRIPGAPSVDPEKLSNLRTLGQVLAFVRGSGASEARPTGSTAVPTTAPALEEPAPAPGTQRLQRRLVVPVRAKVSTAPAKWPEGVVLVTDDDPVFAAAVVKALVRAGRTAQVLAPGGEKPAQVAGLILTAPADTPWDGDAEARLKQTLRTVRDLSTALRSMPGSFVVAASRRDGAFGFAQGVAPGHALAGGVNGLVKTLAIEWPEVRCRSVDVSPLWNVDDAATALVDEVASDGPPELGLGPAGRVLLALRESVVEGGTIPLTQRDVVVVTGGARGVTAECAKALARETKATLVLMGRSPAPEPEPDWLASAKDEASIKRVLLERAPAGHRPTPRQLAESSRAVMAARDIRATLESMAASGLSAHYRQVDVRDLDAVRAVLDEIRSSIGPVRGIVHGAGVLRDKRIEDKRDDDFDQVLDPKITGLRALLEATRTDELEVLALFSSVSGRFGRRGQMDYALANQALVSIAQSEAARRPRCRVVALDWGPWAGGMVTPSLEAAFKAEGVALIALEAGARAFVDELRAGRPGPVEVVLGAGFGAQAEAGWSLVAAERVSCDWPLLADHRLNGKPVLPFAAAIEWFLSAGRMLADGRPGVELDDVRVLRGVVFEDDREDLAIWAGRAEPRGDALAVPLELRNRKDVVHLRAVVLLRPEAPEALPVPPPVKAGHFLTPVSELYASQLFHGPSLWALRSIEALGEDGVLVTLASHLTSERLRAGPSRTWAVDPLVVDGVFQSLIVWSRSQRGAPCLPARVGALRLLSTPAPGEVKAVIRVRSAEGATVVADVELVDVRRVRFATLHGVECTVSSALSRAFTAGVTAVQPLSQA